MSDQFEISISVKAPASEVWRALTDSDELENWWGDVLLEPVIGGKFREPWEDDDGNRQEARGKVMVVKVNKQIVFSWRELDWPQKSKTICSIEIEDKGIVRTIKLVQTGWETLPEEFQKDIMKDFKIGWNYHLKELKSYLDD